jgi:hypothetical protein
MESLGRWFVGIAFLWVAIVLLWGLAAGVDQPYAWFKWAKDSSGYGWMNPVWLGLALFVVPVGILVFLRDIMTDPGPSWVKWAAPGTFLAVYAFFLLNVLPDQGGSSLYFGIEGTVNPSVAPPTAGLGSVSTTSWLARVGLAIAVLGGVPAVIGAVVGMMGGSRSGPRYR